MNGSLDRQLNTASSVGSSSLPRRGSGKPAPDSISSVSSGRSLPESLEEQRSALRTSTDQPALFEFVQQLVLASASSSGKRQDALHSEARKILKRLSSPSGIPGKAPFPPAMFLLGLHYGNGTLGLGINHEKELALSGWYLTGAEGLLQQNSTEAYLWSRKAADKGLSDAEYAVGYYEENGIGVQGKTYEDARKWYLRAAAQGNRRATDRLRAMQQEIQEKQESSSAAEDSHAKAKPWWRRK
ncbi:MAG: hypothetical protein SGCHY_000911 [Lobulomycetales sp.]